MHKKDSLKIRGYFTIVIFLFVFIVLGGKNLITMYQDQTKRNTIFFFSAFKDQFIYNQRFLNITNDWENLKLVFSKPYISSAQENKNNAQAIPVLLYHGIVKNNDRFNITKENFRNHLFTLKAAGYETITMADLEAFLKEEKQFPEKSFVLTFDDGRKDSFIGAQPLLRALNYHAVMFSASGQSLPEIPIKNPYYLTEQETKHLVKTGNWEVQSHAIQNGGGFIPIDAAGTQGNFLSNKKFLISEGRLETDEEYEKRILAEFLESKKTIEKKLGTPVIAFSYPFGDYGQQTKNFPSSSAFIARNISSAYTMAFKQVWRGEGDTWNYPGNFMYLLKRIEPSPYWSGQELLAYIEGGRTKNIPYMDAFEKNNGWRSMWGELVFNDGKNMILRTTSTNSSAALFLDGTSEWRARNFFADIYTHKGESFTLLTRFQDDNNFIACIYTDKAIRLEETIDGKRAVRAEKMIKNKLIGTTRNVGIKLEGTKGSCFLDNKNLVTGQLSTSHLDRGGIGFKAWDPTPVNSEVEIKKVYAE